MDVTDERSVPVAYPPRRSADWFVSGFARVAGELGRTASVVDETFADGRLVLFAGEPNFRGFTEGTQQLLWNAMLRPDPATTGYRPFDAAVEAQRRAATRSAQRLTELSGRVVVSVRASAGDQARAALAAAGVTAEAEGGAHGADHALHPDDVGCGGLRTAAGARGAPGAGAGGRRPHALRAPVGQAGETGSPPAAAPSAPQSAVPGRTDGDEYPAGGQQQPAQRGHSRLSVHRGGRASGSIGGRAVVRARPGRRLARRARVGGGTPRWSCLGG